MNPAATCRVVETESEREAARRIVRHLYELQGYDMSSKSFERYLAGPSATTFGLFEGDTLYGTISLIRDSVEGLPMDTIYRAELAALRLQGKKLAEVVQFAVDHEIYTTLTGKKPSPFEAAPLFAAVLSYALATSIDYLCISINPKHDRFYSLLGFTQIGEEKQYDSVGAPAIARVLSVEAAQTNPLIAQFLTAQKH